MPREHGEPACADSTRNGVMPFTYDGLVPAKLNFGRCPPYSRTISYSAIELSSDWPTAPSHNFASSMTLRCYGALMS